jgi:2-methylaconitate cis-trans-isomerase PrpF
MRRHRARFHRCGRLVYRCPAPDGQRSRIDRRRVRVSGRFRDSRRAHPRQALGKSGYESKAALDADSALLTTIARLRRKAAARMGLPDAPYSVLPKVALLAPPREGGSVASRFYVPWNCHVAHSTTGALCIAAATRIAGTIAAHLASSHPNDPREIVIELSSGRLAGCVEAQSDPRNAVRIVRASVVLTARPLFDGFAFAKSYRS